MDAWVEREVAAAEFPDARLKTRLGNLLGDLGARIGRTVPMACQDWAATKAAYRFFDNPRVDDQTILAGHFSATADRFSATTGTVLVLHDTTEFSFTRDTPDGVGQLSFVKGRHPIANFFVAGNSSDRGGVRVAAKDADGDDKADVAAGSGEGSAARVRVYLGKDFAGGGEPAAFQDLAPFGGAVLADGVYVG
jgi:hypothetical protein